MKSKSRNILLNIIVAAIALFFILFLSELIIRFLFPQNLNYTEFDPYLVYKQIPGFETKYTRQEFSNILRFNSKGLRDYEYEYEKRNDTFRVLVLGSSFTQAVQISLNETYENVLESILNKNNKNKKKYEVINGAVGGYSTAQELIFLRNEGLKYNPDLILLDFSVRDIGENQKTLVMDYVNGTLYEKTPIKASIAKKVLLKCSSRLNLCALIQGVAIGKSDNNQISVNDLAYIKDQNEEFDFAMGKTLVLIKEIKNVADQNKIPLAILILPHKQQIYDSSLLEFAKSKDISTASLDKDKTAKIVEKFAKENNIQLINLIPEFRSKNNTFFYYQIDGHWNEVGHAFAANAIHKELISQKILVK